MDWVQIFDQLVAFNGAANKPFILEALDHHFDFWIFIQSSFLSELCLFNRYHDTLCEGINGITIRNIFICLLIECNKLVKMLDIAHGVAFRFYSWQEEWPEKSLRCTESLLYTFIALKKWLWRLE